MEDRNRPLVEGVGGQTVKGVLSEYLQGQQLELVTSMGELFHGALAPAITEATRVGTIERMASAVEDMMKELEAYELAGKVPPKKVLSRPAMARNLDLLNRAGTLEAALTHASDGLRMPGIGADALAQLVLPLESASTVMDIMVGGYRSAMKPTFTPNGGRRFKQSSSCKQRKGPVGNALSKLEDSGRIFTLDMAQVPPDLMGQLHLNKLIGAPKGAESQGRICVHGSGKSSAGDMSLNEGIDLEACDAKYPPTTLTTVSDICTMACEVLETTPGDEAIHGATADVRSAYQQVIYTPDAAMLRSTVVDQWDPATSLMTAVLVIYLVGVFGDARTGHVLQILTQAICDLHNKDRTHRRSKVYSDDFILVSPESRSAEDLAELLDLMVAFFGQAGISEDKVKRYGPDLEAIGWSFDLRRPGSSEGAWRVRPKPRGMTRMVYMLFIVFKLQDTGYDRATKYTRRTVLQLSGLLGWYSIGAYGETAFVRGIQLSAGYGNMDSLVTLSDSAKDEIDHWRALIIGAHFYPRLMSTDISMMRTDPVITYELVSDACTEIGGGAYLDLADHSAGAPHIRKCVIRWTPAEKLWIEANPGAISVLEYATKVYACICWSDLLQGHTVLIRGDNTAAVSWIRSHRTKGGINAQVLVKVFALFCAAKHIRTLCVHIPGVLNVEADYLSRDVTLQEAHGFDTEDINFSRHSERLDNSRKLLHRALNELSSLPSQEVLRQVQLLL
jgi:hypothetical protein